MRTSPPLDVTGFSRVLIGVLLLCSASFSRYVPLCALRRVASNTSMSARYHLDVTVLLLVMEKFEPTSQDRATVYKCLW